MNLDTNDSLPTEGEQQELADISGEENMVISPSIWTVHRVHVPFNKSKIKVPDLPNEDNEENTDTDDEYHDIMSPPRQTRGPRSPTVRMLNDARLELEECISAIDARKVCRNKKANTNTEIKE